MMGGQCRCMDKDFAGIGLVASESKGAVHRLENRQLLGCVLRLSHDSVSSRQDDMKLPIHSPQRQVRSVTVLLIHRPTN